MDQIDPRMLAITSAALLGLVSHQMFKRNEPTVYGCLTHIAIVNAGLTLLGHYLEISTPDLIGVALVDLAIYLATLGTSIAAYRLFFHPLNDYPGPLLCKLTRFVATYHVLTRDTHLWMVDLHKKYGDAVRISPNELSYTSISSVDVIHGAKAGKVARGPFYSGDPNRPSDSMLSTQNLEEHRWRRKIWERGFGTLQLKTYEGRVVRHLDTLVSQLKKRENINMTEWCEFFAYDVMSDLGFSEEFGMLKEGKPHRYVSALHGNARVIFAVAQTPWLRPLMWLFPIDEPSKQDGKDFSKITRGTYERRKAKGNIKQQDMFETIANNPEGVGPRPLTEGEVMADAALIIMAGSTSTALCIAFAFYYLCQDQSKIRKLQAEVDKCWDGVSLLEVSKIGPGAAPYLNGVIEESLRIYPPAPAAAQRRTPDEGLLVDGKVVPGKTQISVNPLGIQRDERYFSKPNEYIPERWIDDERPNNFNHDPKAFMPFTIGQYACLGKNLAYQEIRLFIAKVVANFDFKFAPGYDVKEFEKTIKYKGTLLIGELPLVFTARQK